MLSYFLHYNNKYAYNDYSFIILMVCIYC